MTESQINEAREAKDDAARITIGARHAVTVLSVALTVALLLGFIAIYQNRLDAHHFVQSTEQNADRIADIVRIRADNQIAACRQANVTTAQTRSALTGVVLMARQLTPQQRASFNDFLEARLPYRDCSPNGIKAFLDNPPPDPGAK